MNFHGTLSEKSRLIFNVRNSRNAHQERLLFIVLHTKRIAFNLINLFIFL
jgi:hypothetical protein